ncbi:N-6 DNA methylase [Streptomyces sp. N2-109]|uniref:N-6 DNA methylase n=1 Tax=Streptomyces gossypii TaxID=2883101 RepID=A0ABT2JSM0_9ACTN|nr:N-6 DNA methylase [Streptomyces gossypii]MCT2590882.1 N-6 DNA methylase [Streptomyces gossypii]
MPQRRSPAAPAPAPQTGQIQQGRPAQQAQQTPARVTAAEISRLAGVTRATVSNWRRRHPDFPAPSGGTEASPAYDLGSVEEWLAARGQLPSTSPADRLRTQLRKAPGGATTADRLLPLILAARRAGPDRQRKWARLADAALTPRLAAAVRAHAADVPDVRGEGEDGYRDLDPALLRAVLDSVREDGEPATLALLAERQREDSGTRGSGATPEGLATLMAELLRRPDGSYPASVLDPACATGALLTTAGRLGARTLRGQDSVASQAAHTAVALGVLASSADTEVHAGDSLRADAFPQWAAEGVLCNPPFADREWGHDELAFDPRWEYGLPPRGESELAWAQHCLSHLEPGALAVLLMPPGVAERASARRIRAALVRRGALHAVLALPSGVAQPLHVGLHVWVLQQPGPAGSGATAQQVLFVDTAGGSAGADAGSASAGGARDRRGAEWEMLSRTVLDAWRDFAADPEGFAPVDGTARTVHLVDLLDETVDLTPARHVRTAVGIPPEEHAEAARSVRAMLRRSVSALAALSGGQDWQPADAEPLQWHTTTVADLARGAALTVQRAHPATRPRRARTGEGEAADGERADGAAASSEVEIRRGDVILPELLHGGAGRARVAEERDEGRPLGQQHYLLRPDPEHLDPWFLAGFLSAEENVRSAATGSTIVRVDARRLRVPLLPLAEQQRYGRAFRRLRALRSAADLAGRLADEAAHELGSGLTSGSLLPPGPDEPDLR